MSIITNIGIYPEKRAADAIKHSGIVLSASPEAYQKGYPTPKCTAYPSLRSHPDGPIHGRSLTGS